VAGITGIMIGLPALRVKGMYLAIATLAFGFILEEVVVRAEHITGGNAGKPARQAGGLRRCPLDRHQFLLPGHHDCCALRAGRAQPAAQPDRPRLRRHPRFGGLGAEHGHQPGALQDRGLRPVGRLAGIAGALYAHKIRFISPDQFGSCSRSSC
jgi:branched-chain amino acid transport system permease protein